MGRSALPAILTGVKMDGAKFDTGIMLDRHGAA
jgi:hypothetical protein